SWPAAGALATGLVEVVVTVAVAGHDQGAAARGQPRVGVVRIAVELAYRLGRVEGGVAVEAAGDVDIEQAGRARSEIQGEPVAGHERVGVVAGGVELVDQDRGRAPGVVPARAR